MGNLKIITTDEFVEKFDKDMLEDEDLKAIYFQRTFEDTDNSYWEEVENGEYYIVLQFISFCQYFLCDNINFLSYIISMYKNSGNFSYFSNNNNR